MGFTVPARRIFLAPALALALAAAVTACSSSSSSPAASAPASSAPASSVPASSAPAATSTAAAAAEITANWEKFFNSSTPLSQKVGLVQNGSTFSSAISTFLGMPLASGIGAKVTAVAVNSATSATVTYNITSSGGSNLLSGQTGTAVYQDGVWKVGDASLCALFKLIPGGTVPAACSSAN